MGTTEPRREVAQIGPFPSAIESAILVAPFEIAVQLYNLRLDPAVLVGVFLLPVAAGLFAAEAALTPRRTN